MLRKLALVILCLGVTASANAASDVSTFRFYHALNNGLYAKTRQAMLENCPAQKESTPAQCEANVNAMAHDFVTYATIRMAQNSTAAKIAEVKKCHAQTDAACKQLFASMNDIQSDWDTKVKPARLKLADYFSDKATEKDIDPIDAQTKKFIVFSAMDTRQQADFEKAAADKCKGGDSAACKINNAPLLDEISAYQVFKFTLERSWDDALISGKCTDAANASHKECQDLVAYSAKIGQEFGSRPAAQKPRHHKHK